jgi:hypothetical protein
MDPFARKMWHAGIAFAVSLLLLVGGLKIFSMHEWPACPDTLISETASPGRQWMAAILQRRCGEDTPFFTHVSLRSAGPLDRGFLSGQVQKGSVFVVERDAVAAGVTLFWSNQNVLTVRCAHCTPALVHQRDQQWGPVTIRYELP